LVNIKKANWAALCADTRRLESVFDRLLVNLHLRWQSLFNNAIDMTARAGRGSGRLLDRSSRDGMRLLDAV
jgi:hypothetical protein